METRYAEGRLVHLKPGTIYLSNRPLVLTTILGSCISVTMWHRESHTGGMCHALLPRCGKSGRCTRPCRQCGKYVDCALSWMLRSFASLGIPRSGMEVKVFGGAMLVSQDGTRHPGEELCVGERNVQLAMDILGAAGMDVKAADTGGRNGRKIFFNTATGEILLKRIRRKRHGLPSGETAALAGEKQTIVGGA